ncbi:LysR family transcriptional regulator [Marinobacter sp.]|uniref:LysR family transcriptional regulator n=1 Tax=Marinobacter sp. TaxID=50741 RepID=UPI0035638D19
MDWDNLKFFLELSRAGKLTAAARRMGVDHTTVSRRIHALEKSLGMTLFIREQTGYSLTEAGRRLLPQVEQMESASVRIEQSLPEADEQLSGQVRIGATEGYGTIMLGRELGHLTRRYPHLHLDLLAMPRALRLSRHEADIVITLERPERGPFIVTKLTDYVLRLYASRDYLEAYGPITSRSQLGRHKFVSYVDDMVFSRELLFLDEIAGSGEVNIRSTSVLAQQEAIATGAGIGILPAFSADIDDRLAVVLPDQIRFIRTFWMLMPEELRHIARMRVTWDFLRERAEENRGRLMATSAPHTSL